MKEYLSILLLGKDSILTHFLKNTGWERSGLKYTGWERSGLCLVYIEKVPFFYFLNYMNQKIEIKFSFQFTVWKITKFPVSTMFTQTGNFLDSILCNRKSTRFHLVKQNLFSKIRKFMETKLICFREKSCFSAAQCIVHTAAFIINCISFLLKKKNKQLNKYLMGVSWVSM